VRLEDGGKDDEGRLDGGEVADGVPLGTKLVEGRADTLGLSLFGNVGQSDTEGCAEGCPRRRPSHSLGASKVCPPESIPLQTRQVPNLGVEYYFAVVTQYIPGVRRVGHVGHLQHISSPHSYSVIGGGQASSVGHGTVRRQVSVATRAPVHEIAGAAVVDGPGYLRGVRAELYCEVELFRVGRTG